MASHHCHHPHHHHHTATCCSACSGSQCCPPPPPSQPPQQSDLLLQALASLLLPTQPQPQHQQHNYLTQTHFLKTFQDQGFATKSHHFHQKHQHQHQQEPNFLLSSLLSRISALESSLQHFSSTTTPNFHSYPSSCSLKDAAARVIQTHFRAFLVHRSRTLRELKDLAFIKSSLSCLKLSVSNKTHFDYEAVSRKAMDLLLKLDSFQGGDPMIRDGKRSVSRELVQFLDYVDGLVLKRHKLLYKNAKNGRVLGNGSKARNLRSNSGETLKKLRGRVEKLERLSRNEEGNEDDGVELEGFHQVIDEGENPTISVNRKGGVCVTQKKNGEVLVKMAGSQPRSVKKKTVSFAENGNVYRIISSENEASSSGDGSLTDESESSDDHGGMVDDPSKQSGNLAENEDELSLENKGSLQSSDAEKKTRVNSSRLARSEIEGDYQIQDGDFVFSAPLPVKMESKADLMKRKGALKIVS